MTGEWTQELENWIRREAVEAGFDTAGVAEIAEAESAMEMRDAERFSDWVEAGRAGEMDYLKRRNENGVLLRSAVQVAIPWARSVVVCAMNYNAGGPRSTESAPNGAGWIARYAWSGKSSGEDGVATHLAPADYHDEMLARLRRMERSLHDRFGCESRCYVDTGPLVERAAAVQAGIGWIGKNTCLLNQGLGSWLLLGVIVTSIPMAEGNDLEVAADRCGSCTRCIDACPTGALVAPREMDASLCIAYLTIEKKGAIAEKLREPMGRQVFGCDICQDVCPWNRQSPIVLREGSLPRKELINPALEWLAGMDADAFRRWFKGSPLERTRRKRLHRNVAIAMGNSGERRFLPQLETWALGEDAVLAEAAGWALERLGSLGEEDVEAARLSGSERGREE